MRRASHCVDRGTYAVGTDVICCQTENRFQSIQTNRTGTSGIMTPDREVLPPYPKCDDECIAVIAAYVVRYHLPFRNAKILLVWLA